MEGLKKVETEDQIARHQREKYDMIREIHKMQCTDILKQEMLRALEADSLQYNLSG